jgi:hypothetical protein
MGVVRPGEVILWAIATESRSLDVTTRIVVINKSGRAIDRSRQKRSLGMKS